MADKTLNPSDDDGLTDGGAAASGDRVHGFRVPNSRSIILGGAAGLDVGQTAGTVAAGDDDRIVDAFLKSSDDTDGITEGSTNLFATAGEKAAIAALGTVATLDAGTSAGNVPLLDGAGLLDESILPALAITDTFEVASQVAMLALTAQRGDIAVRSDLNKSYILKTAPASTLGNWVELRTPTDTVLSVAALTGAISAPALKTALAIAVADLTDASPNGRSLISAADYAAMRTALGLVIGTDVQAYDAQLSSLIRQNSQSTAYTLVLTDGGKHIYHPVADTTARVWTIPANSSVAFPIGTAVTFDNDFGAGAITIAITTDTLVLVGAAGSTGSRTLASGGQATAIKVASTRWRISGTGLT